MRVSYDPAKRDKTLLERGLDFDDAPRVLSGLTINEPDDRYEYGEERWITTGMLDDMIVVLVWTERSDSCRIISMRKAHDHERKRYREWLG